MAGRLPSAGLLRLLGSAALRPPAMDTLGGSWGAGAPLAAGAAGPGGGGSRGMAYLLGFGGKPWETLARKLQDEGFKSVYLDRLQRKVDVERHVEDLEKEILMEIGGSLKKTEDKVNYRLLLLEVAARDINHAHTDESRKEAIVRFNKARVDALDARRDLTIQREAAGMRIKNWDRTQRLYPIPNQCPLDAREAPKPPTFERASLASPEAIRSMVADWKLSK